MHRVIAPLLPGARLRADLRALSFTSAMRPTAGAAQCGRCRMAPSACVSAPNSPGPPHAEKQFDLQLGHAVGNISGLVWQSGTSSL